MPRNLASAGSSARLCTWRVHTTYDLVLHIRVAVCNQVRNRIRNGYETGSTDADKKAAAQLLAHFSSITDFTIWHRQTCHNANMYKCSPHLRNDLLFANGKPFIDYMYLGIPLDKGYPSFSCRLHRHRNTISKPKRYCHFLHFAFNPLPFHLAHEILLSV
jgi:hypothetical protein